MSKWPDAEPCGRCGVAAEFLNEAASVVWYQHLGCPDGTGPDKMTLTCLDKVALLPPEDHDQDHGAAGEWDEPGSGEPETVENP